MRFCFGAPGVVVLNISLIFLCWGSIAAYTVILGDVLPDVLKQLIGSSDPIIRFIISRRGTVIFCSAFILYPVSAQKSLAKLAKFSLVGLSAIVLIIVSVVISAPLLPQEYKGDTSKPLSFIHLHGIQSALSTFAFAYWFALRLIYSCQQNALLNYHAMKDASINRFKAVVRDVMISTVFLTILW